MQKRIFTSESVTEGHPDKVCDQISDGVLDAIFAKDPNARVACECAATTGMVLVMGEISTNCYVDIPKVARETICRIGYDRPNAGFDGHSCAVLTAIDEQSGDIAMGVNSSYDEADTLGAGDQGMMFGFACDETPELMPAPITFAHKLTRRLAAERKNGALPWLRPDGKSQVSVQYDENGAVERIDTVVVSTQHAADIEIKDLREAVIEEIIKPTLPEQLLGKMGRQLWEYANGLDAAPVRPRHLAEPVKSVGNGTTFPQNLVKWEQIRAGLLPLCDSVATRLRRQGLYAGGVSVAVKDAEFRTASRQTRLTAPTHLMRDIYRTALELTGQIWKPPTPVRALTVTALYVTEEGDSFEQMDLLGGAKRRQDRRQEQLEGAMDAIRRKYGRSAIAFGDGEEGEPHTEE